MAVEGMEMELTRLLAGTNVSLKWIERTKAHSISVLGRIVIVDIVGSCELTEFGPAASGHALAWNDVTDGVFQPFITVDCERLARFIARDVRSIDRNEKRRLVGRAIARVLAHEMYHLFTRTKYHSRASMIFRTALPPESLIDDDVDFRRDELDKLEHGILNPIDCDN
jgi:hypothetical protein